eukprot:COSAG06_NODE_1098_length_10712_cov_8.529633_7_plen_111_part_00
MTWQTCLRFVTRRRPLVLATAPDRAETSRQGGPMHDRTCLEVLQLLLCKFTTKARLPLDSFVPRESTVLQVLAGVAAGYLCGLGSYTIRPFYKIMQGHLLARGAFSWPVR